MKTGIRPTSLHIGYLVALFLLLLAPLQVSAQEARLSIDVKDATLDAVAWYIQQKSNCIISYESDDIGEINHLNIAVKNKTVSEILDLCLDGTDLYYEKEGNTYLIKKKAAARKVYITGIIKDETGEVLPGTTVQLKGTKTGAVSGMDGRYSILIPDQKGVKLLYSFIGMEAQEKTYTGNTRIDVTLAATTNSMEEVVVTGYQNIKRKDLVGSFTTTTFSCRPTPASTRCCRAVWPVWW